MSLTMKEKQAVTRQLALEYKRATKKEKGEILDSVIQSTQYNRSYAAQAASRTPNCPLPGRARCRIGRSRTPHSSRTSPRLSDARVPW